MKKLHGYFLLKFLVRYVMFSAAINFIQPQLPGVAHAPIMSALLGCPVAACAAIAATCFELGRTDELVAMRWAGMSLRYVATASLGIALIVPAILTIVGAVQGSRDAFFQTAASLAFCGTAVVIYGTAGIVQRSRGAVPTVSFALVFFGLLLYYAATFSALAIAGRWVALTFAWAAAAAYAKYASGVVRPPKKFTTSMP
jgi:hypothetical protein